MTFGDFTRPQRPEDSQGADLGEIWEKWKYAFAGGVNVVVLLWIYHKYAYSIDA